MAVDFETIKIIQMINEIQTGFNKGIHPVTSWSSTENLGSLYYDNTHPETHKKNGRGGILRALTSLFGGDYDYTEYDLLWIIENDYSNEEDENCNDDDDSDISTDSIQNNAENETQHLKVCPYSKYIPNNNYAVKYRTGVKKILGISRKIDEIQILFDEEEITIYKDNWRIDLPTPDDDNYYCITIENKKFEEDEIIE